MHDPLCPLANLVLPIDPLTCVCVSIREARADTAERIAQAIQTMEMPEIFWHNETAESGWETAREDAAQIARSFGASPVDRKADHD